MTGNRGQDTELPYSLPPTLASVGYKNVPAYLQTSYEHNSPLRGYHLCMGIESAKHGTAERPQRRNSFRRLSASMRMDMAMRRQTKNTLALLAILGSTGTVAHAQFAAKAEAPTYNASATGSSLIGQDGWTNPFPASGSLNVYTYPGNALSLPVSPFTNANGAFFGAISSANAPFARAQHSIDLSAGNQWTLSYDFAVKFLGNTTLPATAASVSLQPATSATVAALSLWNATANATTYSTAFRGYSATGQSITVKPNGAFSQCNANQWYRVYLTFDFTKNILLSVGLLDFTTNTFDLRYPGLYLNGGVLGGSPLPTALRLFVGGSDTGNGTGNAAAWDNIDLRRAKETVYTVSGQVTIGDLPNPANRVLTLLFVPRDGTPRFHASALLNSDGTFRAYITRKVDANVWIKADTTLAKSININTTNGDVGGVNATLVNGDINNDNRVDIGDLLILIARYNQRQDNANYLETADLTNDGSNDIADLLILIRNYNQTGMPYP